MGDLYKIVLVRVSYRDASDMGLNYSSVLLIEVYIDRLIYCLL